MAGSVVTLDTKQFRRDIKEVEANLPKELRKAYLAIAQAVTTSVRGKVPRRSGRAAGHLKARATQRGAGIAWSREDGPVPYYPWLDFGGRVGRPAAGYGKGGPGSIVRPWLGNPAGDGRYLFPTISEKRDETHRAVDEAIRDVAKRAGFEVRG